MATKLYNYIYKSHNRNYKLIINADNEAEAIFLRDRLLAFYANDAARLEEMLQENGIVEHWEPIQTKRKARIEETQIYRQNRDSLRQDQSWVLSGSDRIFTNQNYDMNGDDQLLVVYVEGEKKGNDTDKDRFYLKREDFTGVFNYTQKVTQQIDRIRKESPALIASIEAYVAAFHEEAGDSRDPIQLESIRKRLLKVHFDENFNAGNSIIAYLDKTYRDKFHSVETFSRNVLINGPHAEDNPLVLPANNLNMTLLMFTVTLLSEGQLRLDVKTDRAIARFYHLLAQGHDINAQDAYGRTALMYIAMGYRYFGYGKLQWGHKELTTLLLKNGADLSLKDHLGKTALDYFIAEMGAEHPATQLIREVLAARSISSSVAESSTSIASIAAGGNLSLIHI